MPGTGDAENPAGPTALASRPDQAAAPAGPAAPSAPAAPAGPSGPGTPAGAGGPGTPADPFPQDLARYLAASTGLPQPTAIRVIADVTAYFDETVQEFVCRRHAELRRRQRKNDEIWPLIAAELRQRRFAAPGLSERQLRRIVYT
jgi:hypothetical protein